MKFRFIALCCFLYTTSMIGQALEVGDQLPHFNAKDENGATWNSDQVKSTFTVFYFYPAAMTGGCTKQACAYRDSYEEFNDLDVTVVGISGDEPQNLKHFKNSYSLNFPLLSDVKGELATLFGVSMRDGGTISREIDGASIDFFRGVTTSRWTFVIDSNRKIIYKNNKVNASEDSATVLQLIKEHKAR